MNIDLDDLERKARAATPGPWRASAGPRLRGAVSVMVGGIERQVAGADGHAPSFEEDVPDVGERCSANAEHIAASNPAVTLALIARIRELEAAVCGCVFGGVIPSPHSVEGERDLIALLEKGAVLP